jgi:hypothetical protein
VEAECAEVASPTVLLHNDLLSGNFLVPRRWRGDGDDDEAAADSNGSGDGGGGGNGDSGSGDGGGGSGGGGGGGRCDDGSGGGGGGIGGVGDDVNGRRVPLTMIDFEYSCYGPRAFDLANHFIEHAGFSCDWSSLPGPEQRRAFYAAYLSSGDGDGRVGTFHFTFCCSQNTVQLMTASMVRPCTINILTPGSGVTTLSDGGDVGSEALEGAMSRWGGAR